MKINRHRFTAALSASLIAVTGAAVAQAPATPPAAPPPAPKSPPPLDLSKFMTPENMAAVGQLLKQRGEMHRGAAEGAGAASQAPDLGGLLKGLGESGDLQKLMTPENMAALGAMLKPAAPAPAPEAAPAPAPEAAPAPAPAPDFGGLLKGLGQNGDLQKLITPENIAALGALLKPLAEAAAEGLNKPAPAAPADLGSLLQGLQHEGQPHHGHAVPSPGIRSFGFHARPDAAFKMHGAQPGACPQCGHGSGPQPRPPGADAGHARPAVQFKVMIAGPDGSVREWNGGDLRQLFQGLHPGACRPAPQAVAPTPPSAPAPDAVRRARVEALIEALRQELLR